MENWSFNKVSSFYFLVIRSWLVQAKLCLNFFCLKAKPCNPFKWGYTLFMGLKLQFKSFQRILFGFTPMGIFDLVFWLVLFYFIQILHLLNHDSWWCFCPSLINSKRFKTLLKWSFWSKLIVLNRLMSKVEFTFSVLHFILPL